MRSDPILGCDDLANEFLQSIIPDRDTKDFSLHFPFDGVATLKVEVLLSRSDVEKFVELSKKYQLQIKSE